MGTGMGVSAGVGVGVGVGLTGVLLALGLWQIGCQGRSKVGASTDGGGDAERIVFSFPGNRELDLLFLIDDSVGTPPQQAKFRAQIPTFINVLAGLPGGLPSLHVTVVSSSLGAGALTNVTGCQPGTVGNRGGAFQHDAACTALPPTANFIKSIGGQNNFTGNLADAVSCIANLGGIGCGFEQQFEATRMALQRAQDPLDPDNAGFLRPNALLAIVMLTNEDDCSVPFDSTLFDPSQDTLADPLGGLQSYRCNEFGHRCGPAPGARPPHSVTTDVTLTDCVSAEDGLLVTVDGFVKFLRGLKPDAPNHLVVAALAGPVAPYTITPHTFVLGTGATEKQPQMAPSCTQTMGTGADPEYALPGIRIKQWLEAFGGNAVFENICAPDFRQSVTRIAQVIGRSLGEVGWVSGEVRSRADGTPDCRVVETLSTAAVGSPPVTLPFCSDGRPVVPCWEFFGPGAGIGGQWFQICRDRDCLGASARTDARTVELFCRFTP